MDRNTEVADATVTITRTFQAPPELVFKAWTDPKMMSEWFARDPRTPPGNVIEANAVPGGRYIVDVIGAENGKTYRMQGTYREVRPPERLSFTWWYEGADFETSIVTIDIRPAGEAASEMTLTHALLTEREAKAHREGWLGCFVMLEAALARRAA